MLKNYNGLTSRLSLVVVIVCVALGRGYGFDLRIGNSFATELLTPFRVLSIAVEDRDALLLGTSDGAIVRATKDGVWLSEVVTPTLIGGKYPPAGHGLTVAKELNRVYALVGSFYNGGALQYALDGTFIGDSFILTSGAGFVGASFEQKQSGGMLHVLWGYYPMIVSARIDDEGRVGLPYDTIVLPGTLSGVNFTGIAFLASANLFIVSSKEASLFVIEKSEQIDGNTWRGRIVAEKNVTTLGIATIEDMTHDPATNHVFVTDPEHLMVFELTLSGEPFHRGDHDASGEITIGDPVSILNSLFAGGAVPSCGEASDSNNDGAIDVSDAVFLLDYLFKGGAPPPFPGPLAPCGVEPNLQDSILGLGCASYGACSR